MDRLVWALVLLLASVTNQATSPHTIDELIEYMKEDGEYEKAASDNCYNMQVADWNYNTNLNDDTNKALLEQTMISSKIVKDIYNEWFADVNVNDIPSEHESIRRQVTKLQNIGSSALEEEDLEELATIQNRMTDIYGAAKICPYDKQSCDLNTEGLSLEPEIESILVTSTDFEELTYVWKAWRDATGKKMRKDYKRYVELSNKAAKANKFNDKGDMWKADYESDTFEEDMDKLWSQVEPLYLKLHSYVREKLIKTYGTDAIGTDDLIPANVLGNMWAQSWEALSDIARPYKDEDSVDLTKALKDAQYKVLQMFETSNDFYMSLGLPTNEVCYGGDSMIEKPGDREVVCHASAWDFCDKTTYRIKMCTEVDSTDFITIHHEMGHIQYFLLYKDQPITFRDGANPGFHEAVGDTIALSVSAPKHLEQIELLKDYKDSDKASLNSLMDMALERVAFLPFGLLIDKWRWDVFSGKTKDGNWNAHWWEYREKYQKIKAPINRSEDDFDPGAKYHVAADSQYINYFVAHILEFQLYRGLCIVAGQYDPDTKNPPLHKCDFYNNKEVGKRLKEGLSLGSSVHWKVALKAMTGEDDLDATAVLDYFDPLMKYFDNSSTNINVNNFVIGFILLFQIFICLMH